MANIFPFFFFFNKNRGFPSISSPLLKLHGMEVNSSHGIARGQFVRLKVKNTASVSPVRHKQRLCWVWTMHNDRVTFFMRWLTARIVPWHAEAIFNEINYQVAARCTSPRGHLLYFVHCVDAAALINQPPGSARTIVQCTAAPFILLQIPLYFPIGWGSSTKVQ